jgi:hypothetical protein
MALVSSVPSLKVDVLCDAAIDVATPLAPCVCVCAYPPAPSLAAPAKELEHNLVRHTLARSLSHRREASDLAEHGILEGALRWLTRACMRRWDPHTRAC